MSDAPSPVFQLGPKITLFPVIHGSGDVAVEVRRLMLSRAFDCLAVPLPGSFQQATEAAVGGLPHISVVVQREQRTYAASDWHPDRDDDEEDDAEVVASYVPIDPCQPVIAALRVALEERIPRAFIDLETDVYEGYTAVYPDPYALKQVRPDQFAAAILPAVPPVPAGQMQHRIATMAARLKRLEERHQSILCLCSMTEWPWLRDAYRKGAAAAEDDLVEDVETYSADERTLLFLLEELPFITGQYELARVELEEDSNLSIDGVKQMLLAARDHYRKELGSRARKISPKLLKTYLQYVRNLTLVERRLTPDFYTLIIAAQQMAGDLFAIHLAQTATTYPYPTGADHPVIKLGIDQGQLPDGTVLHLKSRLPGQVRSWRTCTLQPPPPKPQQQDWQSSWNPFRQCSWPPEDISIEKFRTNIKDAAIALLGTDLARTEKFSTSLKDGLDIRETLRNWHTGDLYVRVNPPTKGTLDCVLMLFDSPADPRDYPWRVTWHAEHHDESTLSLFATDFQGEMVGPGIGLATYGGAMFLFPPRSIPDIWHDPRFNFADTLEERILAAACYHAREKHIALLSAAPPGLAWKQIARRYGKKLIHIPLSRYSQETIQQLRMFHVLNGTHIRSYAAHFIRKA